MSPSGENPSPLGEALVLPDLYSNQGAPSVSWVYQKLHFTIGRVNVVVWKLQRLSVECRVKTHVFQPGHG